ncbi:ABC transporter [Zalerion maritima]|uniref:ABC transporter n=1 Tax=Zalerion maritima TaxID=339359 RepID=A0AAD5RTI9_9PEZI|nr:ABC transporter [Zalerion maritima]
MGTATPPTVELNSLTYSFNTSSSSSPTSLGVKDISLSLPPRSRTLLIGANGAGKTTLLRLLAGKRLAPRGSIQISGVDPFTDGLEGVTYLGLEWVLNPVVRTDMGVRELLASVGGNAYPERRDELVRVLDVDLNWRMHAVSDGERRRVQLAMGLVRPWSVLLLDEVTVDLDVLSRHEFLGWLKRETERRDATIVYATHILDNLADWPTHLVHMHLGSVGEWGHIDGFLEKLAREEEEAQAQANGARAGTGTDGSEVAEQKGWSGRGRFRNGNSMLGELVLRWLRADLEDRGPRSHNITEGMTYADQGWGGYGDETSKRLGTG